jgi:hypothetical protein
MTGSILQVIAMKESQMIDSWSLLDLTLANWSDINQV